MRVNPPARELGSVNAIVAGRARRYEVKNFRGPLSLKSVLSGSAVWETSSGRFEVLPGSVLVLNDGETYSMAIDSLQPVETFCVFFARGFVEDAYQSAIASSADLLDAVPAGPLHFFERVRNDGLLDALRCARDGQEEAFIALARAVVHAQCDVAARVSRLPAVRRSTRAELGRRIGLATEFIHANLSQPLRLDTAAGAASLSPFHFHRIFTALHGVPPHQYITRLRLSRARMLLRSTSRPIVDIAADCGFESATSFTSLFRRTFGVPPAQFRKIEEGRRSVPE